MEENMSISRFFSRSLKNIPDFDIKYRSLKKGENLYDEYSKDTQTVFAEYAASLNDEGNPFIEAIPLQRSDDELIEDFTQNVYTYDREAVRKMTLSEKLKNIALLREQLKLPLPFHEELDEEIYEALLKGYRGRKILIDSRNTSKCDNGNTDVLPGTRMIKDPLKLQSYGSFSLLGYGGSGKSMAVSVIMSHYKQVIVHKLKDGGWVRQILYLVVQCPPNGNMNSFYSNIGHAIDIALGCTYPDAQARIDSKRGLGEKLNEVIYLIERHNVGLIIYDEIQMFLSSKSDGKNQKVNVKTESFNAITTMMNETGVSVGVVGTEIAYQLIFQDQLHQNRRLGRTIVADSYCSNQKAFMRIMNTLIKYQWTDKVITQNDLTTDLLEAFKECSHGIIDLIISLYTAVQHEALITQRKTKISSSFVRRVAKKYYPNLMNALETIPDSEYDAIRKKESAEAERLMKSDISERKKSEQEANSEKISSRPSDKDYLIKLAVQKIMEVTDLFKVKDIIEAAKNLYEEGSYNVAEEKEFTKDVMKRLSGRKITHRKKANKISGDALSQFLNNDSQNPK